MPNWRQVVRERLKSSRTSLNESVISELAAHLEETYESACSRGLTDEAAFQQSLQEIPDWRVLARNIDRSRTEEEPMNYRTKSLWLPSLITLLGASISLALFQLTGVRPSLTWIGGLALTFYWGWLGTLPIIGAVGAYVSRRSNSSVLKRLAAATAPALVMLIVMCLVLPWGLVLDGLHFFRLVSFGLGLINWVVIPALALLVGALPFLGKPAVAMRDATS